MKGQTSKTQMTMEFDDILTCKELEVMNLTNNDFSIIILMKWILNKDNLHMQVIVFIMVDLFEPEIIQSIVMYLKWYKVACRTKEYTDKTLEDMTVLMKR